MSSATGGHAPLDATLPATTGDGDVGEAGWPEAEELEARSVGRFAILRKLGEGGMGLVYAAYDERLARRVAIKLLHGADHARLLREAQALARLSHPNVVQVYEVGEAHGRIFVAMEHVEGPTLAEWLTTARRDAAAILAVFLQAGAGLAAAHAGGLVHRDFKPGNVIVGDDGRARVLDFGLARAGDSLTDGVVIAGKDLAVALTSPLTVAGTLMGTPAYMSPEQHASLPVDARSDQFGFCAALWEALYGERAYAGETMAELTKNIFGGRLRAPRPRPDVPAGVHAALVRGLAADPGARWPTMEALLAVLATGQRVSSVVGDTRIGRWIGGGALVVGLTVLIAVQVLWEKPESLTALDNVRLAVLTTIPAIAALPWLWRRFPRRRARVMIGIAVTFLLASLAVRLAAWAVGMALLEALVSETLIYAAMYAALAAAQRIAWLAVSPAILAAALVVVLGFGGSGLLLAGAWLVALAAASVVWRSLWSVDE